MRTGAAPQPIDWYSLGAKWSQGSEHYADRPAGDAEALATRVAALVRAGGCP